MSPTRAKAGDAHSNRLTSLTAVEHRFAVNRKDEVAFLEEKALTTIATDMVPTGRAWGRAGSRK